MCEGASKQTPDLKILPRRDRAPPAPPRPSPPHMGLQLEVFSGGSRNFKTGGGGGRIFRSGVCFDAPSHILYVFVARVVNKIRNVSIVY